ncbi:helix-turn-helix transcriptional regulator [Vibrio sp. SCSIO 43140]|nr:LuxR C-terminal-related transcriptional regulator [Vibrio sp. SCSIO 43140]USD63915.1 helix-turn-helix transcriptional regulator [Vibrio sp. SCSIO 43140]
MAQARSQRAVLLAANTLQSCLLKDMVEQNLDVEIRLISPERLNYYNKDTNLEGFDLIIADCTTLTASQFKKYHDLKTSSNDRAREVLINASPGLRQSELLQWQHLVGVFYINDDLDKVIKGFGCILEGEMWLSRKLLHEYIMFYRDRVCASTNPDYSNLTKREQQIIKLLSDGASNVEIAERLFVSENTVKAHLHNTFKKINVTNRVQALIWAKNNISVHEYA